MKIDKAPVRRIRVMVHEVEGNRMVPGTSKSMALYETTAAEVFALVEAAIKAHIAKGA